MNFKIYFVAIIILAWTMLSTSSHAAGAAKNYTVDGHYVSQLHTKWLSDPVCNPDDGKADAAYAVEEGAWRHQPFTLPQGIRFDVNDGHWNYGGLYNGYRDDFDEIDYFDLYYKFRTEPGTAKAGKHYKPIHDAGLWWGNNSFYTMHKYDNRAYITVKGHYRRKEIRTTSYHTTLRLQNLKCRYYHIVVDSPSYQSRVYSHHVYNDQKGPTIIQDITEADNSDNFYVYSGPFIHKYVIRMVIYPDQTP